MHKSDDNRPNYELYRAIYYNDQHNIREFNVDEVDAQTFSHDYIQSGIVKDCVDIIVDFSKITNAKYDFGVAEYNSQFQNITESTDFNQRIEAMLIDLHVFGNAYIQAVREDDMVEVYNPAPEICYAVYDELNPQKRPKSINIVLEQKQDDKTYTLIYEYLNGEILIKAEDEKGEKIDPFQVFDEILSKNNVKVRTLKGEQEYYIPTNTTFSLLQLVRINKPSDQFYGKSVISKAVSSKLARLNQMYMLAKKSISISANPKFQISESTARLIEQVWEEIRHTNNTSVQIEDLTTLIGHQGKTRLSSVSRQMSEAVGLINNKLTFFKHNGVGENKYIINDYSLADLFQMIEKLEKEIRSDLKVSEALANPDVTTGAKSGIAYRRLMEKTVSHVENIRQIVTPVLQKTALNIIELENNKKINILPKITFPAVVEEETSIAQTLSQRLNGGSSTNQ